MKRRGRNARPYRTELRQQQAERTAAQILDAAIARLHKGDRTLSYAAIAREAGVSIPTVYRHYPTQQHLFDAFGTRERERHGAIEVSRDSLHRSLREFFGRFDDPKDLVQQGRLDVTWEFSRRITVPQRRELLEQLVDQEAPGLPEPERSYLIEICIVLISTATGEALRGYLGCRGDEMAERVGFALEALFNHAATLARRSAPPSKPGTRAKGQRRKR